MSYEYLSSLPDVTHLFETERNASKYAMHKDNSTTAFREPSDRKGEGEKLQPKSTKTIFMETRPAGALQSWMRDEHIGTRLIPSLDNNNKLTGVHVYSTDDIPKRNMKVGQLLTTIPAQSAPQQGLHPVEINKFDSPIGSKGDVHYGSKISKVMPRSGGGSGAVNFKNSLVGSGQTPFGLKAGGFIDKPIQGGSKTI
jgi:hypothetical protein